MHKMRQWKTNEKAQLSETEHQKTEEIHVHEIHEDDELTR